jgi:hypothetical protein
MSRRQTDVRLERRSSSVFRYNPESEGMAAMRTTQCSGVMASREGEGGASPAGQRLACRMLCVVFGTTRYWLITQSIYLYLDRLYPGTGVDI